MDQAVRPTEDFITRRLGERVRDRRRTKQILLICVSMLVVVLGLTGVLIWAIRTYPIAVRTEIYNVGGGPSGLSVHQWRSDVFVSGSAMRYEKLPTCGDWLHCKDAARPSAIETLQTSSSGALVILVGSHDADRLLKTSSESIRTNPELAVHRADTVRDAIVAALKPSKPLQFVVLARPPEVGNQPVNSDRTVSVTLIDQAAPK